MITLVRRFQTISTGKFGLMFTLEDNGKEMSTIFSLNGRIVRLEMEHFVSRSGELKAGVDTKVHLRSVCRIKSRTGEHSLGLCRSINVT